MGFPAQFSIVARWLAIAMASLALLGQGALAGANAPAPKSCCKKCSCCVSEAPSKTPAPVSTTTPSRGELIVGELISSAPIALTVIASSAFIPSPARAIPAGRPLYQKNCSYLI